MSRDLTLCFSGSVPAFQVSLFIPQPTAAPTLWKRSRRISRTTMLLWSAVPRYCLLTLRPRWNVYSKEHAAQTGLRCHEDANVAYKHFYSNMQNIYIWEFIFEWQIQMHVHHVGDQTRTQSEMLQHVDEVKVFCLGQIWPGDIIQWI